VASISREYFKASTHSFNSSKEEAQDEHKRLKAETETGIQGMFKAGL